MMGCRTSSAEANGSSERDLNECIKQIKEHSLQCAAKIQEALHTAYARYELSLDRRRLKSDQVLRATTTSSSKYAPWPCALNCFKFFLVTACSCSFILATAAASCTLCSFRSFFLCAFCFFFSKHATMWVSSWAESKPFLQFLQIDFSSSHLAVLIVTGGALGEVFVPAVYFSELSFAYWCRIQHWPWFSVTLAFFVTDFFSLTGAPCLSFRGRTFPGVLASGRLKSELEAIEAHKSQHWVKLHEQWDHTSATCYLWIHVANTTAWESI